MKQAHFLQFSRKEQAIRSKKCIAEKNLNDLSNCDTISLVGG